MSDKNPDWNYHPDLPLEPVPYWAWPPRPRALVAWVWENFLSASDRVVYILFALAVGLWIQPVTPDQASLQPGWVLAALLRNYIALLIVAGGLHIWFYGYDAQGNVLRFDQRPITGRKNALFKFSDQTKDNMFYALASGAPIATLWEVAARLGYANDILTTISFSAHPIWFLALFPILTLWQGLHFYFVHRALHHPPIYRHIHSVHHRNVNVGPWSGMSMHPVEHLLYFSSLLIFLVLPSHPLHMIFLLYWQLLGAPSGHSGYEAVWIKDKRRLFVGGFFHQLHHRYYECNYGSPEIPFDKWFGTFHDGSDSATKRTRARKREMHR